MKDKERILGKIAYQQAQEIHATLNGKKPLTREQAIENMKSKCPFDATDEECSAALSKSLFAAAF